MHTLYKYRAFVFVFLLCLTIGPFRSEAQLQPPPTFRIGELCRLISCFQSGPAPASPQPKITTVLGTITPGAQVYVAGSGFGSASGKLYLSTPDNFYELKIDSWGENYVLATIPQITGAQDVRGVIYVVLGQTSSNLWSVNFIATREIARLKRGTVVYCHDADKDNYCESPPAQFHGVLLGLGWLTGATIETVHQGRSLPATGTDTFEVRLKNGWTLEKEERYTAGGISGLWVDVPARSQLAGFQKGSNLSRLDFHWDYPPFSYVHYLSYIYIVGPKGVPYE